MPQYFFFCSEAYRLNYLTLERILVMRNIKLGISMHIYSFCAWYSMCIYSGMLNDIVDTFNMQVLFTYCIVHEGMHLNALYHEVINRSAYIQRIIELKHQIENIFESIPEVIFVVKQDLSIILRNNAADTLLDSEPSKFLSEVYFVQDEVEHKVKLADKINELISKDSLVDLKLGKSKVREKTYEWKMSLVRWEGQAAVTLLMRDVTALIQLEQAKHEAHIKNVMLRSVSHELRTPANAFKNLLEQSLKVENLPCNARVFLELAHDNCQHILHVVNDLLDFSQFMHGSFRLSKRKFDVRQVLKNSFKPYEYMIKAAGLTATLSLDASLPVNGYNDPTRISQVVMNLLSNATKFTKNGEIKLSAKRIEEKTLEISVSDTGVGISKEQQANLCKLFGKLKENESLNPQGCGLGLHISNLLALQLGGQELRFKSTLGQGATFTFTVSMKEDDCGIADYSTEIEEEKLPFILPLFEFNSKTTRGRVLVVDDNVFNREIIASILQEMGMDCMTASSGKDAINACIEHQGYISLMLLDYEMPELNGPQTARHLREMQASGEVLVLPAIVAYTAYNSEKDIQECRDAGMVGFLSKPCSIAEVKHTVLKYCNMGIDYSIKSRRNFVGVKSF
eukprot:CAMPEP_0204912032 /NCGR_PEP_ID=MMETSP1397-20131031/10244_1 /ASSEMBLY_ACC=CAM_ASM_000891 /TAXON_ID=49980 /ORGANISM="Climacostomum Climacostomum virens, Strain Stock W-24" /LENGTH=622 /DNA_ID=CAMNT_0052082797 /DNA_START=275 /DNA_END=2143 /DNA_ORIENTATION=+